MRIDEHKLLAFHEKELEMILNKLKLLEKFHRGELKCECCNVVITKDNFGGIFKKRNEIGVVCDKMECLERIREDKV